jgi:hypothetical protein
MRVTVYFPGLSDLGGDASEDYIEFIGAKKHLVLAVLSNTGPLQGSTAFAIG